MKTTNVSSSEGAKTATCSLTGRLTNIFSCPVPAYGILSASRCLLNPAIAGHQLYRKATLVVSNLRLHRLLRSPNKFHLHHPVDSYTDSLRFIVFVFNTFTLFSPHSCSLHFSPTRVWNLLFLVLILVFACFDFCFLLFVFFELKFLVSVNFCTILWNLLALFLFGRLD